MPRTGPQHLRQHARLRAFTPEQDDPTVEIVFRQRKLLQPSRHHIIDRHVERRRSREAAIVLSSDLFLSSIGDVYDAVRCWNMSGKDRDLITVPEREFRFEVTSGVIVQLNRRVQALRIVAALR